MNQTPYGTELLIELYGADAERFTRDSIEGFLAAVCGMTQVMPGPSQAWGDETTNESVLFQRMRSYRAARSTSAY